jgi:hypothetical protein
VESDIPCLVDPGEAYAFFNIALFRLLMVS